MPIKACLFDLDGTLVDSMGLIVASFRETALHFLGTSPPDAVLIEGVGTPLMEQLSTFTGDPQLAAKMRDFYAEYYIDNHNDHVRAFPEVGIALEHLKSANQKLGIVTSKNDVGAMRALKHCHFDSYFDTVVTVDSTTQHKPKPQPVLKALSNLGATPMDAVFVGDSTHDLIAGEKAGTATAAVGWTVFDKDKLMACKPTLWLEKYSQIAKLPELLSKP